MKDVVLYVGGGAMAAVFSVGVLDALQSLALKERLLAVHAVSAGAFNASLFVTGQPQTALRWYTKVVAEHNIIRTRNPIKVMRGEQAVDMEAAERAIAVERFIDVPALIKSSIPFFVKVVDAQTKEVHYLDARRTDAIRLLCASATLMPYARNPTTVDGKQYMDGASGEILGIQRLKTLYPGAKLIIILNSNYDEYSIQHFMHWLVTRTADKTLWEMHRTALDKAHAEIEAAKKDPSVVIITPPADYAVDGTTMDERLLLEGYRLGEQAVKAAQPELQRLLKTGRKQKAGFKTREIAEFLA